MHLVIDHKRGCNKCLLHSSQKLEANLMLERLEIAATISFSSYTL